VLGIWRKIQRLIGTIIFLAILLGGLKVGLRAFPAELIPMGWLQRFQDDLRTEIAQPARDQWPSAAWTIRGPSPRSSEVRSLRLDPWS
jgi:hypothetical protein